jgi:hypothetical protein
VVVVVERGRDQDRAEDLRGEQRAVRAFGLEQGGLDEVALLSSGLLFSGLLFFGLACGDAAGDEFELGVCYALFDEAADPVVVGF